MARPRQHKHSQTELAAMAGVSVKSLREWKKSEGLDLGDVQAVMARAGKVDRLDDASRGESYSEARRRRAIADANVAEIRAKREVGSVVDVADVRQAFHLIGVEFRSRLLAMRGELVMQLHGLDEPGIYRVLDENFRDLLIAIADRSPIPKSKP